MIPRLSKPIKSFCFLKHFHPSKSEASYCNWLLSRVQSKEIIGFKLYPSIRLHINGKFWKTWKADFCVIENNRSPSIHESKGWNRSDDSFKLKMSAFLTEYPQIPLYVNKVLMDPTSKKIRIPDMRKKAHIKNNLIKTWDRQKKCWVVIRRNELI